MESFIYLGTERSSIITVSESLILITVDFFKCDNSNNYFSNNLVFVLDIIIWYSVQRDPGTYATAYRYYGAYAATGECRGGGGGWAYRA